MGQKKWGLMFFCAVSLPIFLIDRRGRRSLPIRAEGWRPPHGFTDEGKKMGKLINRLRTRQGGIYRQGGVISHLAHAQHSHLYLIKSKIKIIAKFKMMWVYFRSAMLYW